MPPPTDFSPFAAIQRLIVVAAHPDDLECMCGGTVYRLAQRGVHVTSVNCTLGDLGDREGTRNREALGRIRLEETDAAAALLGVARTANLGRHDGELVADLPLRAEVARLYRQSRADTLFTFDPHWSGQIHPDHRAAGRVAIDAYMPAKMPLYHPEQLTNGTAPARIERIFVFGAAEPAIFIDVAGVYEQKLAACRAHTSQFPNGDDDLAWLRRRDSSGGAGAGLDLAETFAAIGVW